MILHGCCTASVLNFGKTLQTFDLPFSFQIWSQFASDRLWASLSLSEGHEDFTNEWRNAFLIHSVQRQVQTPIEHNDAQNVQVSQELDNFSLGKNVVAE